MLCEQLTAQPELGAPPARVAEYIGLKTLVFLWRYHVHCGSHVPCRSNAKPPDDSAILKRDDLQALQGGLNEQDLEATFAGHDRWFRPSGPADRKVASWPSASHRKDRAATRAAGLALKDLLNLAVAER